MLFSIDTLPLSHSQFIILDENLKKFSQENNFNALIAMCNALCLGGAPMHVRK
jgi:hypothetical protein